MIKQTFRAIAIVAGLCVAAPASADVLGVGSIVEFDKPGDNTTLHGGGPFDLRVVSGVGAGDTWKTFCLEVSEYINYSDQYEVKAITDRTTSRNVAISDATKAIYHWYRDGASGWSGADVQYAIWFLESQANGVNNAVAQWGVNNAATYGFGGGDQVYVVQLIRADNKLAAQDQLMIQRAVPEPGSMLLVGLGLLASGAAVRRRQRVQ
ncbi:MAG: PEP-CTERM sorting domain-containing protein [Acidobacteria bacterium]|nr:PEP-CTERM sorting domain-containing protein [Acidobacteriota bacterium]